MGWCLPTTRGLITDIPGSHRANGRQHTGFDISIEEGAYVYAVFDGIVSHVVSVIDSNPSGRRIYIQHPDGSFSRYLHLSYIDTYVGANISSGDFIARVGSSGPFGDQDYVSHLHYERRDGGDSVIDPFGDVKLSSIFVKNFTWNIGMNDDEIEYLASMNEE